MKFSKDKQKGIKNLKVWTLCIAVVAVVVAGSGILAYKLHNNVKNVQAAQNTDEDTNTGNDDAESLDTEKSSSSTSDTPEYIEHYINQQMKGEMPDGADGKKVVYLTFDDGPSETVTPSILDTLKNEGVNATFFVVGKAIDSSEKSKELLKKEVAEGNAIGNHSYNHDYKILYPNKTVNPDNFMNEVEETNQSIKNVLGDDFKVTAVRYPGGHMTWKGTKPLDDIFKEKGYHYIDWNALSKDAEGPKKNAQQLKEQTITTAGTKEKLIILMHDTYGKEETAKALPDIIKYFKNQGYEFRTIQSN